MATTTTTSTAPPPLLLPTSTAKPVARPYTDFLTPAFHRRFTHSALILSLFCWITAIVLGSGNGAGYFWSWFPLFSLTGLRTFLRMMVSDAETVVFLCTARWGKTLATFMWYGLSAWIFGEMVVWSKGPKAGLSWIDVGREWERARVNENSFYLRTMLIMIAMWQAGWHLAKDVDRLPLEEVDAGETTTWTTPLHKLGQKLGGMASLAFNTTIAGTVFGTVFYFAVPRKIFWPWAYSLASTLHRNLQHDERPPGLLNLGTLLTQTTTSIFLLLMLWNLSNTIFTIHIIQPPLKKGQPLTSEVKDASGTILSKSRDPNGSLIRGLLAKRDTPKTFAFWELYLICTTDAYQARRRTIYTEVDKQPASTWSQVSKQCLAEIENIPVRIRKVQDPAEYQKKAAEAESAKKMHENLIAHGKPDDYRLPRIADRQPLDGKDVFVRDRRSDAIHTIGNVAKSFGQSPGQESPLMPTARKAIEWTESRTGGREAWSKQGLEQATESRTRAFLKTWAGTPFRQTFAARANAVVFGVPFSAKMPIVYAIKSLTTLATLSLKEDDYGQVAKDIPAIVRTLTTTIININKFVAEVTPSWTDVGFADAQREQVEEVKEIVGVLKQSLRAVLLAFDEYAGSLGLSRREVREAKEAVGMGREVEMRRV
ncbi:Nucleoporin NDC1 [Teratosphaeria destructans]|uniref:Nucleoporin NDC1 n=1 Tax=Teratosphaeria destructans TaxID=418781 RepID=A0A9W7SIB3_9PEZI|nr:Nucleoporin NDC1 [Teratosphaeria destructans]